MLPKGLKLLQGAKQSEDFTVNYLKACCGSYPEGCGHEKECSRLFDRRCGEWHLRKDISATQNKMQTITGKYADWIPTLNLRESLGRIRKSIAY